MLSSSLYIILCTARNRMRVRLRRLREPRYLIGAIAGAAYLYVSFFARFQTSRSRSRRGGPPPALPASLVAAAPAFAGLLLMAGAIGAWIFPVDSGLLTFSDAELQFLFPAPVSRRQLLIHRMLRSQLGMLFGAVMIGIISGFSIPGSSRLKNALGVWMLMVTAKIYFTGVTLARARLGSATARIRRVAWLPVGILLVALAVVGGSIKAEVNRATPNGPADIVRLVGHAAQSGASQVVLWPFVALVRPLFASWPQPYLTDLAMAFLVLCAMAVWVLMSDGAFQEAVADIAERRSQEPAQAGAASYKVRSSGWSLAPSGRPETAFAWKAAMQTLRIVDKRSLMRAGLILFFLTIAAATMGRANGFASMVAAFSFAGTGFAIVLAPQVLRIDMRQDLSHLEVLKTWPVKASAVIRGELLWPGTVITAGAWVMLTVATSLSGVMLSRVSLGWRMGGGAAIAILAPALVFAQLAIHNAVALMFPAWVPLGNQRPRGLDAMGQRLIMLGGTWLLLVLSALPGAIAGGVVWFGLQFFIGPAALVPAAFVCTGIIGIEVLMATEAMGPAYERLDMTGIERPE